MRRAKLRLGEHYGRALLHRRVRALRLWELEHPAGLRLPEHVHERTHLVIVVSGSLDENSGAGRSTTLNKGAVALYPRETRHQNLVGASGLRSFTVEFDDDFPVRAASGRLARLGRSMVSRERSAWRAATKLIRAARRNAAGSVIETAARELLSRMIEDTDGVPSWIGRIQEHLQANQPRAPSLQAIASDVGRHPAHVMREFRRHVGVPLGEYERALRVADARRLLRLPSARLCDIAAACGFADQSHFTRTFKRFTNMTPDEYRKS